MIIQNGFSCEREIKIFLNMYFDADEEPAVISNFSYDGGTINAYTVIYFNGGEYADDYYFEFDADGKSKKLIKKIFTAACTKSFIHAAAKIRGISNPWGVMCGIRPAKNVRELCEEGYSYDEIRGIFRDVYEVRPDKTELAVTVAKNEAEILSKIDKNAVGLYIGIPFCPTRCLYCSFVSTDIRVSGKYMDTFCEKLIEEIQKTADVLRENALGVQSVYIGGGTPTALDARNLERVLAAVSESFDLSRAEEYTLEAGRADTITREKLEIAKRYGVDRISINPQTMNDDTLRRVGRRHSAADVVECFKTARKIGFDNINMDLIAGLPGESYDMFCRSLDEVARLDPEDITVHTLSIKHGARLKNTDFRHTAEINRMLSYAQSKMEKCGRVPYYMYRQKNMAGNLENVGYAKPGKMSMYNIGIMEETQTVIAMGGGGSTKIVLPNDIVRVYNYKDPKEYAEKFENIIDRKNEISEILGGVYNVGQR
ncbi:MAG: coproporphyrinogen dehydrogenase HemZ [Firmicutes bacterium]|nr:coproporphyrinogen dehydrogenase HemZ [Bacillota bacterium]